MTKKIILSLASLTLASGAFAFQTAQDPAPVSVEMGAPVSRTQVEAELQQYQQQLASAPARAQNPPPMAVASGTPASQAQVQADLQRYRQRISAGPARAQDPAPL